MMSRGRNSTRAFVTRRPVNIIETDKVVLRADVRTLWVEDPSSRPDYLCVLDSLYFIVDSVFQTDDGAIGKSYEGVLGHTTFVSGSRSKLESVSREADESDLRTRGYADVDSLSSEVNRRTVAVQDNAFQHQVSSMREQVGADCITTIGQTVHGQPVILIVNITNHIFVLDSTVHVDLEDCELFFDGSRAYYRGAEGGIVLDRLGSRGV